MIQPTTRAHPEDPARTTRWSITLGLAAGGALAGAVAGIALTVLGKIVAGAPPADAANDLWNAAAFGIMGAVAAPLVTWSALRTVPLWRSLAEPLAGAVIGAGVGAGMGLLLGSSTAFLVFAPLGAAAAAARLQLSHRGAKLQ